MITYEEFSGEKVEQGSSLILLNKLHFARSSGIIFAIKEKNFSHIVLARYGQDYVACGLLTKDECPTLNIFVKKEYRRLGIGTKIKEIMRPNHEYQVDDAGYKFKFWFSDKTDIS